MIQTIPLNKLQRSPRNVRRAVDEGADDQLKADIAAHGLLQNLVVTANKKPRGSFAVEAGGRRLRALQQLAEEGAIADTFGVSCLVLDSDPGAAQEASLAENFQQLRMNPADECLAFQQLAGQGLDADAIARRFGLTRRFVEGRLRLADLAPAVFEALGAGEIGLDVAKAFAATSDRDRQALVFDQMRQGYGISHPDSIRRLMTQATVPGSDRRAKFIGEQAYVAAGGRIERDLFADDETARWLDVDLLERLATEQLEALATAKQAELGLGFVRPTLDGWIGYRHTADLAAVPLEPTPLTEVETAQVAELESQLGEAVAVLEDEAASDDAREAAELQVRQLDEAIDAIEDKLPIIDADLKDQLGTFLLLDDQGRPRLHRNFYMAIVETELAPIEASEGGARSSEPIADEAPAKPAKDPTGLSQRHGDELAMQRRDILAVHLAADAEVARTLATFLMVDREVGCRYERSGSTIAAHRPTDPVLASQMPETAATAARREAAEALDRSWAEHDTMAERFAAFRALAPDARAAWLGHAVANSLEASLNLGGTRACGLHDQLGELLGVKVADWWRPTAANYFDRVPKPVSLAALAEVGGQELAARYAKSKKAELAESCERIFAGDAIVEAEVKLAALAWVPEPMRFVTPPWLPVPTADAAEPLQPEETDACPAADLGEEAQSLDEAA